MRHGEKRGALPDRGQGPQHGGWKRREPSQPRRIAVQRAQRRARRHKRCLAETKAPVPDGAGPRRNRRRHRGRLAHGQQSGTEPASRQQPDPGQGRRPGRRGEGDDRSGGRRKRRPGEHLQERRERGRRQRLSRQHGEALRPQHGLLRQAGGDTSVRLGATVGLMQRRPRREQRSPRRRRHGRDAAGADAAAAPSYRRSMDPRSMPHQPTTSVARSRAGATASSGRSRRSRVVSTSGAIPARPVGPLPPSERISNVSAWSPAWCPSSRCRISAWAQAASSTANRAERARSARPGPRGEPFDLEHLRRDAKRAKLRRRYRRLLARFRAQTMVGDQRKQRSAALPCPGVGEQRQGHAVGTARDARRDPWRRLERPERRHGSGKLLAVTTHRTRSGLPALVIPAKAGTQGGGARAAKAGSVRE